MRRLLFPIIIGLGGIAILLSLAVWQLNRLDWKEGVLADIEAKLAEPAIPLPADPDPETDNYRTVIFEGRPMGSEIRFLNSGTAAGTGHQIITRFETTDGRFILVDLGLQPLNDEAAQSAPRLMDTVTIEGNLLWPDDGNYEPANGNEFFGRRVQTMAVFLGTEPIYVVLSRASEYDPRTTPLPVDTRNIKNDHLEYAITWILLAVVWGAMTLFYVVRGMRAGKDQTT
ncbi:MAG: SURF1 family protein [Pseudomonadota bacterium]